MQPYVWILIATGLALVLGGIAVFVLVKKLRSKKEEEEDRVEELVKLGSLWVWGCSWNIGSGDGHHLLRMMSDPDAVTRTHPCEPSSLSMFSRMAAGLPPAGTLTLVMSITLY